MQPPPKQLGLQRRHLGPTLDEVVAMRRTDVEKRNTELCFRRFAAAYLYRLCRQLGHCALLRARSAMPGTDILYGVTLSCRKGESEVQGHDEVAEERPQPSPGELRYLPAHALRVPVLIQHVVHAARKHLGPTLEEVLALRHQVASQSRCVSWQLWAY